MEGNHQISATERQTGRQACAFSFSFLGERDRIKAEQQRGQLPILASMKPSVSRLNSVSPLVPAAAAVTIVASAASGAVTEAEGA